MSAPVILQAAGVSRRYGAGTALVRAVDGVSLEVAEGEVLLIEGPSGSGKTSLLMLLGMLLRPTEGRVTLRGERVDHLSPARQARARLRDIGFVFQHFNLLPALTAEQNVRVPMLAAGLPAREAGALALELLEGVGLARRADHLPGDLSGGEQQRVAIARALANRPSLILADEPTANLDSVTGQAVMELLAESVRKAGGAMVVVSHDARIERLADRIVRMEDGRLVG